MTKKSDSPSHSSQPTVACPTCKQSMVWSSSNPNRPFCSERCKLIDLGEWASESYKVAAAPSFDEYDDFSSAMDPNQQPPGTVH